MKKYMLVACALALVCLIGVLPAAAAGTGRIAYHSGKDANWNIWVMNADGSGQAQLTTDAAVEMDPAWSPDGSQIAYTNGSSPNEEIWVMNADGSGQTPLTSNTARDIGPDWSPDGSQIVFMSDRDGDFEIVVMNADGSGQAALTDNGDKDEWPAWSADGAKIAFQSDRSGYFEVWVMDADGTDPVQLTDSSTELFKGNSMPAWSPGGSQIAFLSARDGGSFVYGMNADGTWQSRLSYDSNANFFPVWSPDGAWIAFEGSTSTAAGEILVMDAHGLNFADLTNTPDYEGNPDWWDVTRTPPTVTGITVPAAPVAVGTTVAPTGVFTAPDTGETFTATWTWGDGTAPQTEPVPAGATAVTATHAYTTAGIYTVELVITGSQGGPSAAFAAPCYIVVYDPAGGYVAGSGTISSPAGAYLADPSLTGPASFGFTSRYMAGSNKKGSSSSVPQGTTEFKFQTGNLNFRSTKYQWMVVGGPKVTYKGTGTVNKKGTYGFLLSAIDGQISGGGGTDKFRVKIWDKATGTIVYDNLLGAGDTADPITVITSGAITITKP